MTWIAGVDGCRAGWIRVCRETRSGELAFDVVESVVELATRPPSPTIVALDMPIGLTASGPRACDRAARAHLGARRSSVFPAPIRAVLAATSPREASEIGRQTDGRGVSAQAYGILDKVRRVDVALRGDLALRESLCEVHPELSFWAWNGRAPLCWSKKSPAGHRERLALAATWLGEDILVRARAKRPRKQLGDDDILDAIAALWTAHRIASGAAETLPEAPQRDEHGLPMRIVF